MPFQNIEGFEFYLVVDLLDYIVIRQAQKFDELIGVVALAKMYTCSAKQIN